MESYRKFTVAATRAVGVGESQTGNVCGPLSNAPSCRQSNTDTRHWQTTTYYTIQLEDREMVEDAGVVPAKNHNPRLESATNYLPA